MSKTIEFPDTGLRGAPSFRCEIPDDWATGETASAWVAFRPPEGSDVSLLVSSTRVDDSVDLRDMAVRSFAHQRRLHPSVTLDSQRVGRFGDRVAYVRGVTVPSESPVAQVHAIFFAPDDEPRDVADVFTVVGTCPADDIDTYGPIFVEVIASFAFTGAPS